ncbi:hypothetical protein F4802DRAFT_562342 [Xylaria palmicola]|nr:hypothetical protein F4802DRAFT_562342 [Xylaria palmicola]
MLLQLIIVFGPKTLSARPGAAVRYILVEFKFTQCHGKLFMRQVKRCRYTYLYIKNNKSKVISTPVVTGTWLI